MTTPIQDIEAARADPAGFVWTLLLTVALVAVIGLIAYLVIQGEAVPAPVERAVAARLPSAAASQSIQAPAGPEPKGAGRSP